MEQGLVYDVGVNDGTDTAYYLHRGYKVVGIEASPVMAEQLRERFKTEIAQERFKLLVVGVAEQTGEMEFWLSDMHEWSSFDRTIASRNGTPHRAIRVPTQRFSDIVAEHGIPYFCKIDIEGNDRFCLLGMTRETAPPYISIEMNHESGDGDLELLRSLGYTRFKIISQVTRAQPYRLTTWLGYALPAKASDLLRKVVKRTVGKSRIDGWKFNYGSSGSFGPDTSGPWHDFSWALSKWRFLSDIDKRYAARGLGEWFDVHAMKA
jgi:FkbM family methyltransferase